MNSVQPHRSSRRWALPLTPRLSGFVDVDLPPPPPPKPKPTKTYTIPRKPLPKEAIRNVGYEKTLKKGSDEKAGRNHQNKLHYDSVWYLVVSAITGLLPLAFIVLGILTAQLHGQHSSLMGGPIKFAILLVPSVFPVLFALLMSKSLRSLALERSARGIKLGRLEQLMGSQTVGGTLVTAFSLRMFDYTTLFLVLIWALSPLGGQAALRMLYMESAVADRFPATVWYRNSDSYPVAVGESAFSRHSGRINAVYLTSLLAPKTARASNRDTYGNIKIPYIEEHEVTGEANAEGWHYVYSGSENYSSLIGVPIQFDIPSLTPETVVGPDNKATFTIETSYFRFDCHRPLNLSENMINKRLLNYLHYPDSKNRWRSMSLNLTEAEYGSGRMSSRSDAVAPRKLEFISRMDPVLYDIDGSLRKTQYYSYSRCSMTTSYVESNVTCLDFVCQVSAMRRSRRNHAPDHLSLLDGAGMLINHKLYDEFSVAGIQSPGVHTTMSERYLFDPETFWNMSFQSLPNIPSVDAVTFSKRLGTIFNTYWNIYQSPMGVVSIGRNLSAFEPSPDAALEGSPTLPGVLKAFDESHGVPFLAERTHTEFIHSVDAYFCAWPWLVCFVTSACILTFISLAGLVLQAKRIAPDIFWVAGLTRDSPYFRVPEKDEDSTLNGWERTKRLKNMEVMIADVEPEAKTGKIAFMAIDENVGDNVRSWSRLSLARRYR